MDAHAAPTNKVAVWAQETVGFFRAVRLEMEKVTWPTRPELLKATRMIVVLSVILGIGIGLLDWILQKVLVDGVAALAR